MSDEEEIAAESRAYSRRFPFLLAGGLCILLGLGLLGAGLDKWPFTVGAVALGLAIVVAGEMTAKR